MCGFSDEVDGMSADHLALSFFFHEDDSFPFFFTQMIQTVRMKTVEILKTKLFPFFSIKDLVLKTAVCDTN